ncbi:MAG: FeoB-associated Cys-rich membrane protein [Epsilonproteobacteria bacterium]|nr:FeoB-associated Cys-rich membrane protein [Campylobacterota bacterium]
MLENIFLGVITLGALYYLYRILFKTKGCGCGKDGCNVKKEVSKKDK